MRKLINACDMAEIARDAVVDDGVIDCADSYLYFLEDLAALLCKHFGGIPGPVTEADDVWRCEIEHDDNVPENGGVWSRYDKAVDWSSGNGL